MLSKTFFSIFLARVSSRIIKFVLMRHIKEENKSACGIIEFRWLLSIISCDIEKKERKKSFVISKWIICLFLPDFSFPYSSVLWILNDKCYLKNIDKKSLLFISMHYYYYRSQICGSTSILDAHQITFLSLFCYIASRCHGKTADIFCGLNKKVLHDLRWSRANLMTTRTYCSHVDMSWSNYPIVAHEKNETEKKCIKLNCI